MSWLLKFVHYLTTSKNISCRQLDLKQLFKMLSLIGSNLKNILVFLRTFKLSLRLFNFFVSIYFLILSIANKYLRLQVDITGQGILKEEVSLYHWPPVWLVWNQLYEYWQFLFLFAKLTNPNQSNRRSMVQWYFPFSIPCTGIQNGVAGYGHGSLNHRHLRNIDCLSFVMCPLLASVLIINRLLFFFFFFCCGHLQNYWSKQGRQCAPLSSLYYLDVYDLNRVH